MKVKISRPRYPRTAGLPNSHHRAAREGGGESGGWYKFSEVAHRARRSLKLAVVAKHEAERKWCRRKPVVFRPPRRIPSVHHSSVAAPCLAHECTLFGVPTESYEGAGGEFELRSSSDATRFLWRPFVQAASKSHVTYEVSCCNSSLIVN